jgi:hypothetical protein
MLHAFSLWFHQFLENHRSAEWIAAFALIGQLGIFMLHAWILHRHSEALDETVKIASTQAETGKLMATALDQQSKILAEQAKIMDEQFNFQRSVAAQADRQEVFTALLRLRESFHMLIAKVQDPSDRYAPRIAEEQQMLARLLANTLPVQRAFISSVHLTPEEKDFCGRYLLEVSNAVEGDANLPACLHKMKAVDAKYSEDEFLKMVTKIGKPQE